jgi:hypothetical protein
VKVVRDPNFVRAVADTATAVFIGRDIEISLLALSPTLTTLFYSEDSAMPIDTDHDRVHVEMALVRMSPSAAEYLCYNVLFSLLQSEQLDFNKLQRNVDQMREQLPVGPMNEVE